MANTVSVLGLGSMGLGMAKSLLRSGFNVVGCDVAEAAMSRFQSTGGRVAGVPADAVAGAGVVVCVVINAAQTEDLLFGTGGVAAAMAPGSVFLACATMSPDSARQLVARLADKQVHYLDAPISGGAARAAEGKLTVMASGSVAAFAAAEAALGAIAAKVYQLGDQAGAGAAFKMINQHLAGVHIAAAAEAMAFAARQGLDLKKVYEVITASAGNSWMFENRVPHILSGDYTPQSSIEIFVKDMGIVQDMARAARYPTPLASAALQMYLSASGAGLGKEDDAAVAKIYARLSGAVLPGME